MKSLKCRLSAVLLTALLLLQSLPLSAVARSVLPGTGTSSLPGDWKGSLSRVDGLDTESLRRQYFSALAEANRANFSGERWVVVELGGDTLYTLYENSAADSFTKYCESSEGQAAREKLEAAQEAFLARLDAAGVGYEKKYSYTAVNNGLALRVNSEGYKALKNMDGVSGVYFSESYAVPTVAVSNNANVYTTGIYNTTGIDYKGEGMVVAILDTGLDYTHEAFVTMPKNPAWSKQYVADRMAASSIFNAKASVDDVYYNAKVPFAYDYADDDADVFPQYSSHGTHVAGIVGGKSDYVVNKETGETFLGVAPEAQLVICKVFTDNLDSDGLGGADSIDILAALSDCVELGVDVINMSLGSSAGFADEKSNSFLNGIYERIRNAGISLVVAASNDYSSGFGGGNGTNLASNPDSSTVGAPSTYPAALSVASINGQKASYIIANDDENQVAFITESSDGNGNSFDFVEQLYRKTGKNKGETLRLKYVVIGGVGRPTNYTAQVKKQLQDSAGYDGVIALVKRGDTTFAEKVQNAMDNGADAVIIYNNLSGTIRMSLGEVDDPVPTCAISMDAGKVFVDNAKKNVGTISVNANYKAGPFMSDFSSWGPLPDLQLKPEITAHGGEITSAVAGGYDIYSGTSMAAPNMAGAVALLRQYLKTTTDLSGTALNARVNQMLMSTATIALNEEGNPYSPRKQGAGLAGIADAIAAESYITVRDKDGNIRDKTKIELYDDKEKTGVYTFSFLVNNLSGKAETYDPQVWVMTETLASDKKTVAEKAYILSDSTITLEADGKAVSGNITVPAGKTVSVTVTIKLGDAGRKYLDESFVNGMYVEGFVSLQATGKTKVTIGLPYLAFYGDWNDAPLFDYSEYELAESQKDTGVPAEDKLVASAASTKVIGMYYDDKYILSMGSYLYSMEESDVAIYPDPDKIALSMFDTAGQRTIYELYMVYAGLLRGAAYMDIEITDDATGDVVYKEVKENVSKSYAAGGSNRGSAIMMEIKAQDWGLINNSKYRVHLKGQLDYPGGENPDRSTFDFTFTIDYEAPQVLDYRIRYDSYTENKQTKYRIYMDVDVYDNQYVQDLMPCYIRDTKDGKTLTLATQYPIPVYGEKGTTSTVSFEITDIYEEYVKTGKLYLVVEDYAMNQTSYLVQTGSGLDELTNVTLKEDEFLSRVQSTATETAAPETSAEETGAEEQTVIGNYQLFLAPNQLYKATVATPTDNTRVQNLEFRVVSGNESVAVKGTEIYALSAGRAMLELCYVEGEQQTVYAEIELTVEGTPREPAKPDKLTLSPVTNGNHYVVNLETDAAVTLHPNTTQAFQVSVSPWYVQGVEFEWSSSNDEVASVDETGNVTTHKKGTAYITVKAKGYDRLTKSVRVTVDSDYRIVNYTLYDYYGGAECVIPEDLNVMYLDEECFRNNTTVRRIVLPSTLTEIPERAFEGCINLEEIFIPSQCIVIGKQAFSGCQKLQKVTFGMFVDKDKNESDVYTGTITIGPEAFKNCRSLSTIQNMKRMTSIWDSAFAGCVSLTEIDLTELRVAGNNIFSDCTGLTNVIFSERTAIGKQMFSGCTRLASVTFPGNTLAEGTFNGCSALRSITFTSKDFIGFGAFSLANTALESVTLPAGTYSLGEGVFSFCTRLRAVSLSEGTHLLPVSGNQSAFSGCDLFGAYTVPAANPWHTTVDGILYSKDITELVSVPYATESLTIPAGVTAIAGGAFAEVTALRELDLSGITSIGAYAFAGSGLTRVTLPAGLDALPDGLFYGCRSLTEVTGLDHVRTVGRETFRGCVGLRTVDMPVAERFGEGAFRSSGLSTLHAPALIAVGARALEGTAATELTLPALADIGYRAFANMKNLTSAVLGPVTRMDAYVFSSDAALTSVYFGDGATVVGDHAFFNQAPVWVLTTVRLPDSMTYIGAYAFANQQGLTELNLSGVQTVEQNAFTDCAALTSVDLSRVETVGKSAFSGTALTAADLTNASRIDEKAFSGTPLTSVTFGKLEVLGAFAFSGTKLTTVTLPASFSSLYYTYVWDVLDTKGRVKETRQREVQSYGDGAFANIPTLTAILVADGSEAFESRDGVLYGKAVNGSVLLQYPAGRDGKSYAAAAGTVRIGNSAFEGVGVLKEISFPYTVSVIGSYAFYKSTVTHYTFNSVEAPVLLSSYVDPATVKDSEVLTALFERDNGLGSSIYYANFLDFVAKQVYADVFNPEFFQPTDFGLHLTIPKNGTGYDTKIWTCFFGDIGKTDDIQPDNRTHAAMNAMDAMKALISVADIAAADSLDKLTAISEATLAARRAYNQVVGADQIALCADRYETLLTYEKALRDAKARLGSPVALDRLELASRPDKIRYNAGETFDPTGMVIKAVYADESEVIMTDYTLDKTTLSAGDESVTVTVTADGKTYTLQVLLNVQGGQETDTTAPETETATEPATETVTEPDTGITGTGTEASAGGTPGWVLPTVLAAVILVGGAVAAVLILRRRKGN